MKKAFQTYLKSIGFAKPLLQRATVIMSFFEDQCGYRVEDIFVDEYLSEDGGRNYEAINFFTRDAILTAQNFTNEDDYSMWRPVSMEIHRMTITKKEYDFEEAIPASRLNIEVSIGLGGAEFKASGENCTHLWTIFKKYFLPLMQK